MAYVPIIKANAQLISAPSAVGHGPLGAVGTKKPSKRKDYEVRRGIDGSITTVANGARTDIGGNVVNDVGGGAVLQQANPQNRNGIKPGAMDVETFDDNIVGNGVGGALGANAGMRIVQRNRMAVQDAKNQGAFDVQQEKNKGRIEQINAQNQWKAEQQDAANKFKAEQAELDRKSRETIAQGNASAANARNDATINAQNERNAATIDAQNRRAREARMIQQGTHEYGLSDADQRRSQELDDMYSEAVKSRRYSEGDLAEFKMQIETEKSRMKPVLRPRTDAQGQYNSRIAQMPDGRQFDVKTGKVIEAAKPPVADRSAPWSRSEIYNNAVRSMPKYVQVPADPEDPMSRPQNRPLTEQEQTDWINNYEKRYQQFINNGQPAQAPVQTPVPEPQSIPQQGGANDGRPVIIDGQQRSRYRKSYI